MTPSSTDKFWDKAAVICINSGLTPFQFIDIGFKNWRGVPSGPFPSSFSGNWITNLVSDGKVQEETEREFSEWIWFIQTILDFDSNYDAYKICTSNIRIPAWIRCCLFPEDETILKKYGEEAREYLRVNKTLLELIRDKMGEKCLKFLNENG